MSVLNILKQVCRGYLDTHNTNLYQTLSIYNYGFWFNGSRGVVIVDDEKPVIALVDTSGGYSIYSGKEIGCRDVVDRLEWMLGLGEDLSGFHSIASSDPLLNIFSREYSGWRVRSTSLWWSLVIGVCQQNTSFWQGWRMLYNIIKFYGRQVASRDNVFLLPPTPRDILASPELLVNTGVGYRASTIVRIARAFTNREISFEKLCDLEATEIEDELKKIKGVGPYTARLAIILSFRRYNLAPIDRWLKKIIAIAYGVDEKRAGDYWVRKWREWSGLAALATTIALDAKPLRKAVERVKTGKTHPIENGSPTPSSLWRILK